MEWNQAESGRVVHPFEPVVLGATLAMIPVLVVDASSPSHGWKTFAARTPGEAHTPI